VILRTYIGPRLQSCQIEGLTSRDRDPAQIDVTAAYFAGRCGSCVCKGASRRALVDQSWTWCSIDQMEGDAQQRDT
jgi:hypothetical protein